MISGFTWFYFDRTLIAFLGPVIGAFGLAFNMFGKKSETKNPSSPNFTINSGPNSNNNQASGNINQTVDNGSKK